MSNTDKFEYLKMYDKIYGLLRDTTPLLADCGILCNHRCCRGTEDEGMLLFPGERTTLEVRESEGRRLAVCEGHCNRNNRPLSCMLFPFFPLIGKDGKITIDFDFRGVSVCPLILNSDVTSFNRKFIKNALKAGKLLTKDNECRRFLEEITEEINEAKELYQKLKG